MDLSTDFGKEIPSPNPPEKGSEYWLVAGAAPRRGSTSSGNSVSLAWEGDDLKDALREDGCDKGVP